MNNIELDRLTLENDKRHGESVLRQVYDFLGRFITFPSEDAHVAVALWVLHTYLMDRWDSTPRLALLSAEPASGKTRVLEILELLVPRPIQPVNASSAYLFTMVGSEDGLPTVLFDEIDTVFGPKAKDTNEDVRGFLNAGHRRGAVFGRAVYLGSGQRRAEELPAYCAVALAGLGWLPDTILTRSVVIRMRRRHDGEHVEPYRRRHHKPVGDKIVRQIESWAQLQPEDIEWPEMPDGIQDRDADVWELLLAVADLVGGNWPVLAREAAKALVAAGKDIEPSLGIRLLSDIKDVFDVEALTSKELLAKLNALEEAPWGDMKGKPLDERGLARRLKQFDIKPKVIRVGGATPRGYSKADFFDAWKRYLPKHPQQSATLSERTEAYPQKSATNATNATTLKSNGFFVADKLDVADDECNVADVAHVALSPGGVCVPDLSNPDVPRSPSRISRHRPPSRALRSMQCRRR